MYVSESHTESEQIVRTRGSNDFIILNGLIRGDLSGERDHPVFNEGFTSHSAFRISRKVRIEDGLVMLDE